MGLTGLNEYLKENYDISIFDHAVKTGEILDFHLNWENVLRGKVNENLKYSVRIESGDTGEISEYEKLNIRLVYPGAISGKVFPLIKPDDKIKKMKLSSTMKVSARNHIKNKTLYSLMTDREVVFFTLIGGEKLKGLIGSFARYEIVLKMKGGIPITILRHGVYDLRNKKGRCFLKSTQETAKDWKKSEQYIDAPN